MSTAHHPVLYHEVLTLLRPKQGGRYVDGTLGAGGHARGILEASSPDGLLLGLDVDPIAIQIARDELSPFGERAWIVQASYILLAEQIVGLGWKAVDGVLLDLGISSMQVDMAERGFSFQSDAPLDMRFNPDDPVTAADLVNSSSEAELADMLYRYGEERQARRIARAIVQNRPLFTTSELAQVVTQAIGNQYSRNRSQRSHEKLSSGYRKPALHPATLTFQALRIAVNHELEAVESVLPVAISALKPGGRLAVIAFHSLEDRIVKRFFRIESQDCICPPRQPVCTCGHKASLVELTHRPIQPNADEVAQNPRARSAKLRVAEKL